MSASNGNGYTAEIKFLVPEPLGIQIREWARSRLEADPHGSGPYADEYRVSTLYLDTGAMDVFHRRASYGRSKYRIRRYGDGARVFLERKLRTAARLAKRRTEIPIGALDATLTGDTADATVHWFTRRVAIRRLQPVCRVSYLRMARLAETSSGRVRLTLDYSLSASTGEGFAVEGSAPAALLAGQMILELKYGGVTPAVFRELADTFALTPGRASKYRTAADALGLARLTPEEGAPYTLHA